MDKQRCDRIRNSARELAARESRFCFDVFKHAQAKQGIVISEEMLEVFYEGFMCGALAAVAYSSINTEEADDG